jgi:hypothetical protein
LRCGHQARFDDQVVPPSGEIQLRSIDRTVLDDLDQALLLERFDGLLMLATA